MFDRILLLHLLLEVWRERAGLALLLQRQRDAHDAEGNEDIGAADQLLRELQAKAPSVVQVLCIPPSIQGLCCFPARMEM